MLRACGLRSNSCESWDDRGGLEVDYAGEAGRPVSVQRWTDRDRIAEEVADAREVREAPESVEDVLDGCLEVVGIELGASQIRERVGVVVAYEVARCIAQLGDGVIADDEDEWHRVEDGTLVAM